MARVLLVWELGAQLSHLSNVGLIARILQREGHEIAVALRELQHARLFLSGVTVQYYQAPFKQGPPPAVSPLMSYAHMLRTSGYADAQELVVLLSAWLGILRSFRPQAVVFDHSPTALLASRGLQAKRALIGSGFLVPPVETPLGVFPDAPRTAETLDRLRADEEAIRVIVNRALSPLGIEPLERLSDLYLQADESFLLTFRELDPFDNRGPTEYYGVWTAAERAATQWPQGGMRRVFAYVTAFPRCEVLLQDLQALDAAVLVYAPGVPAETQRKFTTRNLRFLNTLAVLEDVAEQCDLFVSHGAHTSVALTLLRGTPQLLIPNYKEQLFTAMRVADLGAGLVCAHDQDGYLPALNEILSDGKYKEAASRFAQQYQSFDPVRSEENIAARLRRLLG